MTAEPMPPHAIREQWRARLDLLEALGIALPDVPPDHAHGPDPDPSFGPIGSLLDRLGPSYGLSPARIRAQHAAMVALERQRAPDCSQPPAAGRVEPRAPTAGRVPTTPRPAAAVVPRQPVRPPVAEEPPRPPRPPLTQLLELGSDDAA